MADKHMVIIKWVDAKFCPGIHSEQDILKHNMSKFEGLGYLITTEAAPKPDKKTGHIPTEEERARWQRIIPIMNEILREKAWPRSPEGKILVTGLKGPLEEG